MRVISWITSILQDGDGEIVKSLVNGKLENLRRLEAKKNELEKAEERILKEASTRRKSGGTPTSDEMPPPPPLNPPPDATPTGAERLDALIGGSKSNGNGIQASKKVSFASEETENAPFEMVENSRENSEQLSRLEKYEKDPNVSEFSCFFLGNSFYLKSFFSFF